MKSSICQCLCQAFFYIVGVDRKLGWPRTDVPKTASQPSDNGKESRFLLFVMFKAMWPIFALTSLADMEKCPPVAGNQCERDLRPFALQKPVIIQCPCPVPYFSFCTFPSQHCSQNEARAADWSTAPWDARQSQAPVLHFWILDKEWILEVMRRLSLQYLLTLKSVQNKLGQICERFMFDRVSSAKGC